MSLTTAKVFKKADLKKANAKLVDNLQVKSGYSPELAKIYVEYFNKHSVRLGYRSSFGDDIYYSKIFVPFWWLTITSFLVMLILGLIGCVDYISIAISNEPLLVKSMGIWGIFFFIFAIATIVLSIMTKRVARKMSSKKENVLDLETILHYNNVNDVRSLQSYIDEMENVVNRPRMQHEWFSIPTFFWVLFIPILSMYLATLSNGAWKGSLSILLGGVLLSMLIIWSFRMVAGEDILRVSHQEQIKANIFIGQLRSVQHKWEK